jgi:hypothetical protein
MTVKYNVIRYAKPDEQPVGKNPILYVTVERDLTRAAARGVAAHLTIETGDEHFFAKS